MNIKYLGAVIALSLFGAVGSSSAQEAGEARASAHLNELGSGEVQVYFGFTFRLAKGSDGVYPAAELVEIEVPGELNPDGSESSALVFSIPIGSFEESPSGYFWAWEPSGLKVTQRHESYVWDFTDSDGAEGSPSGVRHFWAFIRVRDADEVGSVAIRMLMTDNRYNDGTVEPAPKFLELLMGGPTLRIGNDRWETRPYRVWHLQAGPYATPD